MSAAGPRPFVGPASAGQRATHDCEPPEGGPTNTRQRACAPVGAVVAFICACVVACIAMPASAADPPRTMHGSADGFAAPGVVLAWGVLRGADDATTVVVVRIAADPAQFGSVAAVGIDPFTQQMKPLFAPTPTTRSIDLRVPRAHFSDFPRTELRLFGSASPAQSDPPALVVFFLGVPDTTPEVTSEAALESYLAQRIARARANPGSKPP